MSFHKHPLDDIHVGDYVEIEVTAKYGGDPDYTYTVKGPVRVYDSTKAVGRNGIGEGKIVVHTPRSIPTAFGTRIRYPYGDQWVKIDGENWRSETGKSRLSREMAHGWIMVYDAEEQA